jgi:hypothetical protein
VVVSQSNQAGAMPKRNQKESRWLFHYSIVTAKSSSKSSIYANGDFIQARQLFNWYVDCCKAVLTVNDGQSFGDRARFAILEMKRHLTSAPHIEPFVTHYSQYDGWFERQRPAYLSELLAVRALLPFQGHGLEVGVGTGRFAGH